MIWGWFGSLARRFDRETPWVVAAGLRGTLRFGGLTGLGVVLTSQEWIPDVVSGVLVVPLIGGMLVAGGPWAAYQAIRDPEGAGHGVTRRCYAELLEDVGCGLMGVSGAFAVGALIGLTIIQDGSGNACDGGAWCFAVMWWAVTAGAWTVVAGIWGMTRTGTSEGSALAREVAGRLVVGTTVVAAALLVVFALMFSGAI